MELKNTFFSRLKGLLGVNFLGENQGIVLARCQQVHTFGMKFSIDIVVLDRNYKIIDFVGDLRSNKIGLYYGDGYYIIELITNSKYKDLFPPGKVLHFRWR